jgi:hypothetical protein
MGKSINNNSYESINNNSYSHYVRYLAANGSIFISLINNQYSRWKLAKTCHELNMVCDHHEKFVPGIIQSQQKHEYRNSNTEYRK